jgi:hypothetical protein
MPTRTFCLLKVTDFDAMADFSDRLVIMFPKLEASNRMSEPQVNDDKADNYNRERNPLTYFKLQASERARHGEKND